MCGRFALTTPPDVIEKWFELMRRLEFPPRYNIAPTQPVVAVRLNQQRQREGVFLHWGLIPFWAKDPSIGNRLINARSESAADKPSFRHAMKKRRCLIPASGFYEWKKIGKAKQPYYISHSSDQPLAFAGLWESWTDKDAGDTIESCTILTTDANASLRELHDRMPVVLPRDAWPQWLDADQHDPASVKPFLTPAPDAGWTLTAVSRRVNSPANDDASLLEPLTEIPEAEPPSKRRSGGARSGGSKPVDDGTGSLFA